MDFHRCARLFIGRYRRAAFADFCRAKVSAPIVSAIKSPKPNAVSLTGTFIKVAVVALRTHRPLSECRPEALDARPPAARSAPQARRKRGAYHNAGGHRRRKKC